MNPPRDPEGRDGAAESGAAVDQDELGVITHVGDLRAVSLQGLMAVRPSAFTQTLQHLLARIDQPGASISGYNDQQSD